MKQNDVHADVMLCESCVMHMLSRVLTGNTCDD